MNLTNQFHVVPYLPLFDSCIVDCDVGVLVAETVIEDIPSLSLSIVIIGRA